MQTPQASNPFVDTPSEPQSIWDALKLYQLALKETHSTKKAEDIFNLLMTALTRYTLPGWGYPPRSGRKPTDAEKLAAEQALQILGVAKLKDARNAQQKAFELLQATKDSRNTYSSKLKKFLKWAETRPWYPNDKLKQLTASHRTPKMRHGYQSASNKRVTSRTKLPDYSLKVSELDLPLKLGLELFYNYRTQVRYPGRKEKAVKPKTAEGNVRYLSDILGIIRSHLKPIRDRQGKIISYENKGSGVSLEELSLDLIVPRPIVELKQPYELKQPDKVVHVTEWHYSPEEVSKFVDSLICCVLNFLENERQCRSYHTLLHPLAAIISLIRFHYHDDTKDFYNDIPAMQVARKHRKATKARKENHRPVANEDMKWLDLPDIHKQILNPLRAECEYRCSKGAIRSIRRIAYSFMILIIFGLLTYDPPRRQQEYRNLKIALSCPVQRPEGVAPNQLIHPLPDNRSEGKEIYHGYLYKGVDGNWYKDMTKESYKTGNVYGDQKDLKVPNPKFPNGKCFYDYLEAYLYGYYRDSNGDWQSGGKLPYTPGYKGAWHSLRMSLFEPTKRNSSSPTFHNYVFVTFSTGGICSQSSFSNLFKHHANRLSNKCLTPHLLRDIYTTWFLDGGYLEAGIKPDSSSEQIVAALAYAMATSEKMLLEVYDRRQPKNKRKFVDRVMLQVVEKFIE